MKILKIETHQFAPELNKIHFSNGVTMRAPGVTSFKQYRERNKPISFRIMARVESHYPMDAMKWLNTVRTGIVKHRSEALTVKRLLIDGLIPDVGAYVTVRTWIVGG